MADQEMRERLAGFRAKRIEAMTKRYLAKGVKLENIHAILGIHPNKIDSSIGAIIAAQAAEIQTTKKPQQVKTSSQQPRKVSVANNPSVSAHRLSLAKNQNQPSRYSMSSADVIRPRSKTSGAVSNPKSSSAVSSNMGTSKQNNGSLSTIDAANRGKLGLPTIPHRASASFNTRRDRVSTVPTQEFSSTETNLRKTINVRPEHAGQHTNRITKRNPSVTSTPTKQSSHLMTSIKSHVQERMENQVAGPEEPPTELNRTFELLPENSVEDLYPGASQSSVAISITDYDKDVANRKIDVAKDVANSLDPERKETAEHSEEVVVLKETLVVQGVAVPEELSTDLNRTFELPSENSGGDVCPGTSRFCVTISANDDDKEVPKTDLKQKEDGSHSEEIVALLEETLALQNAMPKAKTGEWLERIEKRCPKVTKYAQFWVAKSRLVNKKKHAQEAFDIIEEGCLAGAEPLYLLDEETTKIRALLGLTPDRRERPRSPRLLQEVNSQNAFRSQVIAYEAKLDKLAGGIASLNLNDIPPKVLVTPVRRSARKRSRARWSNHGAIPFEFDADVLDSMYKENINIEIRPNKALLQTDSEV